MNFQSSNNLYGFPQPLSKVFPAPIIAQRAPTVNDISYPIGQIWVDEDGDDYYGLVNVTAGVATWNVLGATPGNVDTLTGDTGGAITPSAGNINILGGDLTTVNGSGSTLTINAKTGAYPITPYVVGTSGEAGYQTIQSAINAASGAGGGTIYIQPGTYTEDLTLVDGVDLWGVVGIADTATCIIIGTHTPPTSGSITIRNIFLQSATDIFASNAAGSAAVILIDIAIAVENGYTFNLPNWTSSGSFTIFDGGVIGSINDGVVNNTGGALIFFTTATIGAGSANPMITSGSVEIYGCGVQCPVSFQTGSSVLVDGATLFTNSVTLANNSTGIINNSSIFSGSEPAITMSSSGNWTVANSTLTSTNNPSIAGSGAGTLTLGSLTFGSNSSIAGTLTLSWLPIKTGAFIATGSSSLTTSTASDTISIGSASQTGTLTLGQSTAGQTISIGSAINSGSQTVNIASGAAAANSTVNVLSGNATSGTQTLNLATGTGGKTIHIADGAGVNTITLGSTNTTSATTINAGTGSISLTSGIVQKVTSVNNASSPYSVLGTDYMLAVDPTSGAVTVTLPSSPTTGRHLVVVDATGQSALNNITISGNGKNISAGGSSAATKTISTAYGALNLIYNGTIWNAI